MSQTGASAFFLRRKAFTMRLIIRRDKDTAGQGFLTPFISGLHIHRRRSSLLRSCLKPIYMHLTKVNLLSLIPRRTEENHYLLNFKVCQVPYKQSHFKTCSHPLRSALLVLFYTDKENKVQRGEITFPRSHSKPMVEPGFKPKCVGPGVLTLVLSTR